MKKLIPAAALFCIAFTSCRKNFIDKLESPEPITTEVVDIPCEEEEELFGEFMAEATFPGGMCAWQKFLRQNITYPADAVDANVQGAVMVQFLVNANGEVCNVEALSGPEELRQSAVELIRKSPKWRPGIANGRQIKCHKRQPIIFRLEEE
jgi:periplasmic protein TonB